jgi:pyruvate dehydrogenase E2 component (dihydrolipoamide acetyltransferase)
VSMTRRRPPATPLARAVAADLGVDLATVVGSGRGGRILRADVEAAASAAAVDNRADVEAAAAVDNRERAASGSATFPHRGPEPGAGPIQAARAAGASGAVPRFALTVTVDAGPLLAFRAELDRQLRARDPDGEVGLDDLVVKACAGLLRADPDLNVSFAGDRLLRHRRVHVGIAVSVDGRLAVPVVRDADAKSLSRVAAETRDLIGRARTGRLSAGELQGGTFTVSSLGRFGTDQFIALIVPPQAAVLAVGAVRRQPVATPDGQVVEGWRLGLTLSIDHRAVDGATGAGFLQRLKRVLEHPLRIVA